MKKLLILLCILYCGIGYANDSFKIQDYFGVQSITQPVNRVIYIGSFAEVPAMLGVWDKVVGLSNYGFKSDIVKVTAKNLNQIKHVNDDHYAAFNIEALKILSPDLIITYVASPENVKFAKKFGLQFLSFYNRTVQGIFEDIRAQALALGKARETEVKFEKMQKILELIKTATQDIKTKKRVIEIFHKPNQVSGKNSLDSDIMKHANVENIGLKYVANGRAEISLERIVSENPDMIFIWWLSPYSVEDILNNSRFQTITAVKNKQVYKLPPIDIGGPRTPLISLYIALKAYPENFQNININNILQDYYESIFNLSPKETKQFLWH